MMRPCNYCQNDIAEGDFKIVHETADGSMEYFCEEACFNFFHDAEDAPCKIIVDKQ